MINLIRLVIDKFFLTIFLVLSGIAVSSAQLPMRQTQGDIQYISGGIGEDEEKAMRAVSTSWPLSLEFSKYLDGKDLLISHVNLTIKDSMTGQLVFYGTVNGPIFLGKLPLGKYDLVATYEGVTKLKKIEITEEKPLHVSMNWRLSKSESDYPYFSPWGFWF